MDSAEVSPDTTVNSQAKLMDVPEKSPART